MHFLPQLWSTFFGDKVRQQPFDPAQTERPVFETMSSTSRPKPTLDLRSPNDRRAQIGDIASGTAGARPVSRRRRAVDVLPNQCGDLRGMAARKKVTPAFDGDEPRPRN